MTDKAPRWIALRWRALLCGTLVAGAVLLLYGRFLVRPADFFIGDLVSLFQPLRHHWVASVKSGQLPLWSSAIFAGTPTVADPQAATFYPGTALHLLLGFPLAELLSLLLHLILGGWGILWLCRKLGLGWAPATLAALSYCCSGFFVTHLVHPNFIHTAAWIPWAMGGLHRLLETGRIKWLAVTGLAVGASLLAGGLQLAYYGLGAALLLCTPWALSMKDLTPRRRLVRLGLALGAFLLGALLAAIQLIPTAQMSAHSVRAHGVTLDLARSYRMPVSGLLQLFVPYAHGLPGRTPYVGGQSFFESFGYLGVAALPLAFAGLARPRLERLALAALVLLSLWAAAGPEAPLDLHRLLFAALPGFDRFRAHGRLLYVALLGLSLLAAFGLDDLTRGDRAARRRAARIWFGVTLLGVGVAAAIWLGASSHLGRLPKPTAHLARTSALVSAGVLLGCWAAWSLGRHLKMATGTLAVAVIAIHLMDLVASGRTQVSSLSPPAGVDIQRLAQRPPDRVIAASRRGTRLLFAPGTYFMLQNLGMIQGFANLRAYGPMMLRRTYDLLHLADRGRFAPWRRLNVDQNLIAVGRYDSPALRMLSVRHVLWHSRPRAGTRSAAPLHYRVKELPSSLPLAWLVHSTELITSSRRREQRMRHFDPGRVALVESAGAMLPTQRTPPTAERGSKLAIRSSRSQRQTAPDPTAARLISRSTGGARMSFQLTAPRGGLLVVAESWYPGWRARTDGRWVKVHRVNHGLMGVVVKAGSQRVDLLFSPDGLEWGAAASLLALLLILLLWPGEPLLLKLLRSRRH